MKHPLLACFAAAVFAAASTTQLSAQSANPPPQITVSGAAEVKVVPDEVHFNVGVETRHNELAEAMRQHDQAMTNALRFLKSCGLPDKDVQTDYISVQPDYDYNTSRIVPRAFIVRKSIGFKLTTTTNLAPVLTGLLNNGINQVHSVDFRTSQLRKYRDQARAMAAKAAREKAAALAKELDVKLGKPLNVNAIDSGGWFSRNWGGYNRNAYANNSFNGIQNITAAGGESDSAGETLALGQISVSANVTVTFLLE